MEYIVILLFFLVAHPYIFYPASLVLMNHGLQQKKAHDVEDKNFFPGVSLLIAAYNEEKVIADKLVNAMNLDYPADKIEIVVGSDGSTDRTNEIVQAFAAVHPNVKLARYSQREGKVNVLNKAVRSCAGDIIVFSDANALYNKSAIKNIVRHFSQKKIGCVAGEKRMKTNGALDIIGKNEGMYWKLEAFIKQRESTVKTVIGADGALYAIRKELFQPLPTETSVDDFLLSMLIVLQGYRIVYEPESYSYEDAALSLDEELKRKVRIAAGNYYNLQFLRGLFGFNLLTYMFVSHKLLRWVSPFLLGLLTLLLMMNIFTHYYAIMLFLLLGSYLIAILGYCFEKKLLKYKMISLLTHFYLTVFAQFKGWMKYCRGTQKAVWDTVR